LDFVCLAPFAEGGAVLVGLAGDERQYSGQRACFSHQKALPLRFKNTITVMSTADIRAESHQILEQMDERFLEVVHAMLLAYARQAELDPIVSYDAGMGTPRTASELTALLDEELEAVRRGESTSIEDFKKASAQWGQPTK
jgi:hypothetical protein